MENDKGFLGDTDEESEKSIKEIKAQVDLNDLDDDEEVNEEILKEIEAQGKKFCREISEKFDNWYGKNKDYLMREYIDEHQEEFRDFCGKIFVDDKEEKEELSDKDIKINKD